MMNLAEYTIYERNNQLKHEYRNEITNGQAKRFLQYNNKYRTASPNISRGANISSRLNNVVKNKNFADL